MRRQNQAKLMVGAVLNFFRFGANQLPDAIPFDFRNLTKHDDPDSTARRELADTTSPLHFIYLFF
jgi:hypothetical protein